VRRAVCRALRAHPERFAPYVVGDWDAYLAAAEADGTWGDHVTLQARRTHARQPRGAARMRADCGVAVVVRCTRAQAAADAYGVRVCVVTTYAEGGYLEIAPRRRRSQRSLWLSLHAEARRCGV
jgi:hypothetical protein